MKRDWTFWLLWGWIALGYIGMGGFILWAWLA